MSDWISRIKDHRTWELLTQLGPKIDKAGDQELDPESYDGLRRLKAILTFVGKRIGGTDPLLVRPAVLDQVSDAVQSEIAQLNAFETDNNPSHIIDANGFAEIALTRSLECPAISTEEEAVSLAKALGDARSAVDEQERQSIESRRRSQAEIKKLDESLDSLRAQIEIEKDKLSLLAADQTKNFADTILKLQESVARAISEQQLQFSAAQESRGTQFSTLQGDYSKKLADQDAEFSKERDATLKYWQETFRRDAEKALSDIAKSKDKVEKLVGVIGELGVTGGYQTAAVKARNQMWFWQGMSVIAMGGLIFIAYKIFLPGILGEFKWEGLVARLFLTITVGVLAAYSVAQADRFFQMEKYSRRLALELAAVDPFIALLPQEEKERFKLEMARKTFAQEEPAAVTAKSPATALDIVSSSKQVQQLIEALTDIAKTLAKKGG